MLNIIDHCSKYFHQKVKSNLEMNYNYTNFQEPDFNRFPCLRLAYEALKQGGTASTLLNAANEVAVAAFLNETIAFSCIPSVIENVVTEISVVDANSLATILLADEQARELASEIIQRNVV